MILHHAAVDLLYDTIQIFFLTMPVPVLLYIRLSFLVILLPAYLQQLPRIVESRVVTLLVLIYFRCAGVHRGGHLLLCLQFSFLKMLFCLKVLFFLSDENWLLLS